MSKIIRLKINELTKSQIERGIPSDMALAAVLGISASQVWRAKLSPNDERYNCPGNLFISSVLSSFGGPFEKFFYLEEVIER